MRPVAALLLFAACRTPSASSVAEPVAEPAAEPAPEPIVGVLEGLPCPEVLAVPDDADASTLTLVAHTCANQGRLEPARSLIERAYVMTDTDPTTNYVKARILLASRQHDGNGCERDAFMDDILNQLVIASADPALRMAITAQDLFAETRPALRYRIATGVDLASVTEQQVQGLRFYSLGNGAYGSRHKLFLAPDGVVMYSDLTFLDDGDVAWQERRGTYAVTAGKLVLGSGESYTMRADGWLSDGGDRMDDFRDVPSECEA
ncbi:MAG: hypothetical protein ACJAV2_005176 [Myxococcota bacterium]|jgi:hypothetical protein